jgi:hypothetical protein
MVATRSRTSLAFALLVFASACGGGGGGGDEGSAPDTAPPTVASIDPANGSTGAARTAAVVVTFSERIDPATVTAATVVLSGPSGAIDCTRTLSAGGTVLTLAPVAPPLAPWAEHTVQVGTGVADAAGNALAAAAGATFRTRDDVPPAAPGSVAGPAFANAADPAVTFTWSAPADEGVGVVASYDVEVATSGGGTPFAPLAVTTTSAPLGDQGARDGEWLRARVRARDAEGNEGPWSGWSAFTIVDVTGPTATLDPADAATAVSRTADLAVTFSEPMDAASLAGAVTLAEGGAGGSPLAWSGTLAGDVLPVAHAGLANHAVHALSVGAAAKDLAGNPLAPATATFTTADTVAPEAPQAPSGQAFVSLAVPAATFSWSAPADDGAGIASYDWLVATDTTGNPSAIVRSGASWLATSATVDDLASHDGATLHARVRARDRYGNLGALGPWSSGTRVDLTAPALPGPVVDPGSFAGAAVDLSWPDGTDAGSGVAGYEIRVAVDVASYPLVPDFVSSTASFTLDASGILDGSEVRAEIRALDVAGNASLPQESDGVIVDATPPVATQDPQDAGSVSASTALHFHWAPHHDATSGVVGYECDFAEGDPKAPIGAPVASAVPSCDHEGTFGQLVFVRVRARDAAGNWSAFGGWSDGILLDAAAPGTPGTPADDGEYAAATTVAWTWSPPADWNAGTDAWVVHVGTTPGASGVAAEETAAGAPPTYALIGAQSGSTYHLSVAMKRGAAVGAFSAPSDGITVDTSAPGAPGAPALVAQAGAALTYAWPAAVDPESGVSSYEVAFYLNAGDTGGAPVAVETATGTSYTWAAAVGGGDTVRAEVRATNRAGLAGDWSPRSAPTTVDADSPFAWSMTPGWGSQPTNLDLLVAFSEPMDTGSVEAAFSLTWAGGTTPRHGYVFHWSADLRQVTVVPDTEDPPGETNVDVLPESTDFVMALGTSATDLAGNPLDSPLSAAFSTRDETAPALVTVVEKRSGMPSPFDPAFVQTVTLLAHFDEEMSAVQASVRVDADERWTEGGVRSTGVQAAVAGGGEIAYTLSSCGGVDVRVGDLVSVRDASPPEWEVTRAPVTAFDRPSCTVTVAAPAPGPAWGGGGWMAVPAGGPDELRVQWIGPQTLQLELPSWFSLAAGSEAGLELWNVNDAAGNWTQVRRSLQAATTDDPVPPRLLSSIPRDGAAGVDGAKPIILRFSEPIREATASGIAASCGGCPAGLFTPEYSADEFGPLVLLVPSASPPAGALVTVQVPATVEDLAGNPLAVPVELSFTVEASPEDMPPQIRETNPPAGAPVDGVWSVEVAFEDSGTGMLEAIDPRSIGANDVRVVDLSSGLLLRGFRVEADASSAIVRLVPPNGSGLSSGRRDLSVTAVEGGGGVVTYTTAEPHEMAAPGARVWVDVHSSFQFDANGAEVVDVPAPDQFRVASFAVGAEGDGTASIGNAGVPTPRSYEISLDGVDGADGIVDARGNSLDPATFEIHVQPWPHRVPSLSQLRELRLEVATSPAARTLSADVRVQDADLGSLDVSIRDDSGELEGTLRTVDLGDPWSGATYRYPSEGGGGPPTEDAPPALGSYGGSGYYTFEILVDDGVQATSYLREVWMWAPGDVPRLASIGDGGTVRPVGGAPVVIESTRTPAFSWTNMDAEEADFGGLYVLSLDGLGDGPAGHREATIFAPEAAGTVALADPLDPDVYLWTVFQQKVSPGTFDLSSSGWAIDIDDFVSALFAVGPQNRDLGGATFAGARMGFDATSGPAAAFGALGSFQFEAGSAGAAPVLVTASLRDQRGVDLPSAAELFAFEEGRRFTLTQGAPASPLPVPLPMHGAMAMTRDLGSGPRPTFFAVAQEDPSLASIQAGAYRFQESGFGTALAGRFAFVQASASVTAGAGSSDASVGRAAFDPGGLVTVDGVADDASTFTEQLPYSLGDDGLLSIAVDAGLAAEGLLGGAPGAEIGVLATASETDDRYFWLLVAREYGWLGTEDEGLLDGTYRFAAHSVASAVFSEPRGSSGTMTFDGEGMVTYEGTSHGTPFAGWGTYAVDAATQAVTFTRGDPNPGASQFTLVVGPEADLLLGAATDDAAGIAEVIVLAR